MSTSSTSVTNERQFQRVMSTSSTSVTNERQTDERQTDDRRRGGSTSADAAKQLPPQSGDPTAAMTQIGDRRAGRRGVSAGR
jgi:hypothetical protein